MLNVNVNNHTIVNVNVDNHIKMLGINTECKYGSSEKHAGYKYSM